MIPNRNENTSSRMGSFSGTNHKAGIVTSVPKKVLEITVTASPNQLPKRMPQKVVEIPEYINIFRDFFSPLSIFLNFSSAKAQPITIIKP